MRHRINPNLLDNRMVIRRPLFPRKTWMLACSMLILIHDQRGQHDQNDRSLLLRDNIDRPHMQCLTRVLTCQLLQRITFHRRCRRCRLGLVHSPINIPLQLIMTSILTTRTRVLRLTTTNYPLLLLVLLLVFSGQQRDQDNRHRLNQLRPLSLCPLQTMAKATKTSTLRWID